MNQTLTHLASISGIRHHFTIPYSKEENGIVERANKEVNRHIRNILADEDCIQDWPQMLCMTEKLLNSSVKHALGVSPNTLLFGDAIPTEQSLMAEIDRIPTATPPRTIRDYVDKLMDRQSRLIVAAQKSQQKVNADNLEKRYSTYPRTPKVRTRGITMKPIRVHSFGTKRVSSTPAQKWVVDPNDQPFIGPLNQWDDEPQRSYIPLLTTKSPDMVVDTIDNIDLHPYELTKYEVNDYVLRRFPSTKIGDGNPDKYGSYWRGPYIVTKVLSVPDVYGPHKLWYTIRNLTNDKEYSADVTHLRPFYYDPQYVTPINVAARDTNEYVVKRILKHVFTDSNKKLWLVQWQLDGDEDETWEPFEVLKDVEAFHHYCAANGLSTLFPKQHPAFAHLNRSQHKRLTEPPLMTATLPDQAQPNKRRGRPNKAPVSQPLEAKR